MGFTTINPSSDIPHPPQTMTSRTERFERKANPKTAPKEEEEELVRFEPEEEAVGDRSFDQLLGWN
jgi:hypothetical protein